MHKKLHTLHNYEIDIYLFRKLCCRIAGSAEDFYAYYLYFMHKIQETMSPVSTGGEQEQKLLGLRETFPQSGQNIEHFQFFVL